MAVWVGAAVLGLPAAWADELDPGPPAGVVASADPTSVVADRDPAWLLPDGTRDVTKKPWEVGGIVEFHRLFIQNDLAGYANNKLVNYLHLYARWDITPRDALELRGYLYERLLVDPGETGLRLEDTVLHYSHRFKPWDNGLGLRAYANVTAPTSFYSWTLQGLITAPRVGAELSWHKGRFSTSLLGFLEAYIVQYRQMVGGNPNPWLHVAAYLDLDFRLPLLSQWGEPLTIGASATVHRTWYREATGTSELIEQLGVVQDANFPTQPVQGSYGGQVYVRYTLPVLAGLRSDLTVAAAQGDPTLGFTSSLHDGVSRTYLFWRQSSQVFVSLAARY